MSILLPRVHHLAITKHDRSLLEFNEPYSSPANSTDETISKWGGGGVTDVSFTPFKIAAYVPFSDVSSSGSRHSIVRGEQHSHRESCSEIFYSLLSFLIGPITSKLISKIIFDWQSCNEAKRVPECFNINLSNIGLKLTSNNLERGISFTS